MYGFVYMYIHLCIQAGIDMANRPLFGYEAPREIATYSTQLKGENDLHRSITNSDQLPERLRRYSKSETYARKLCADSAYNRRTFRETKGKDLNKGFQTAIQFAHDAKNEHLGLLLECLNDNGLVGQTEFVCKRRCLIEIGKSQWDNSEKLYKIVVQQFNGVYYLNRTGPKPTALTEEAKLNTYRGVQFENYMSYNDKQKLKMVKCSKDPSMTETDSSCPYLKVSCTHVL